MIRDHSHLTIYIRKDYRDLLWAVSKRMKVSISEFIRQASVAVATPKELQKHLGIEPEGEGKESEILEDEDDGYEYY